MSDSLTTGSERLWQIAKAFHDHYERLAPEYGYDTRTVSRIPWEKLSDNHRNLMIATVDAVLKADPGIVAIFANYINMQAELRRISTVVCIDDNELIHAVLSDADAGIHTWETGK